KLRYIGVLATGYNVVDAAAAADRGIPVTNVPDYGTRSVAQLAMALLLELVHRTGHHAESVRSGRWVKSTDFCYWDHPLIELEGMTFGVLGLGRIGLATAELARAFGMKVIGYTRSGKTGVDWIEPVSLEELFRRCDVLSLHCPLTDQTREIVNTERLSWMKPSAFLLNTSRGPLIHEAALADALNAGKIAGAALDVLSVEPPKAENPLPSAKNCLITPHIAWATRAARNRLMKTVVENVAAFQSGRLQNVVNGVKG
ncbi:MAG TPA: D-2-hydroxyacid dehydrogenase, partial [Roseimicrobium sp.]|nr:D-2-hydroxyacid dehydrogenase [Roseimicrobium sp.]